MLTPRELRQAGVTPGGTSGRSTVSAAEHGRFPWLRRLSERDAIGLPGASSVDELGPAYLMHRGG